MRFLPDRAISPFSFPQKWKSVRAPNFEKKNLNSHLTLSLLQVDVVGSDKGLFDGGHRVRWVRVGGQNLLVDLRRGIRGRVFSGVSVVDRVE